MIVSPFGCLKAVHWKDICTTWGISLYVFGICYSRDRIHWLYEEISAWSGLKKFDEELCLIGCSLSCIIVSHPCVSEGLKQNASCSVLWAGWICYIFTVSVMIDFFPFPLTVLSSPNSRVFHYSDLCLCLLTSVLLLFNFVKGLSTNPLSLLLTDLLFLKLCTVFLLFVLLFSLLEMSLMCSIYLVSMFFLYTFQCS